MGSLDRQSANPAFWKELYEAALFEFDSKKLPQRIALAEDAVEQRQHELLTNGGSIKEQESLEDALYGLSALRRISESRRSTGKGGNSPDNQRTGT